MGVPAFYRWLIAKYPKIVCIEDVDRERGGNQYDNLYIDLNGLIHPCSHPEDHEPPASEDEMFMNISKYIDRLFKTMLPRHLLFLAMDGVAPRAKMNQQRSRRFRSAQEKKENAELTSEVIVDLYPDMIGRYKKVKAWDSNVITPGTQFMYRLNDYLKGYIADRMTSDASWKHLRVIFSDASEPGEGEHKIM